MQDGKQQSDNVWVFDPTLQTDKMPEFHNIKAIESETERLFENQTDKLPQHIDEMQLHQEFEELDERIIEFNRLLKDIKDYGNSDPDQTQDLDDIVIAYTGFRERHLRLNSEFLRHKMGIEAAVFLADASGEERIPPRDFPYLLMKFGIAGRTSHRCETLLNYIQINLGIKVINTKINGRG